MTEYFGGLKEEIWKIVKEKDYYKLFFCQYGFERNQNFYTLRTLPLEITCKHATELMAIKSEQCCKLSMKKDESNSNVRLTLSNKS